jgi:hypothetical protein
MSEQSARHRYSTKREAFERFNRVRVRALSWDDARARIYFSSKLFHFQVRDHREVSNVFGYNCEAQM